MKSNWRDKIRKIDPYVPGEQSKDPDIIKLNANENPYPPSPAVEAVLHQFPVHALRRYPDANSGNLRHALAQHFGVQENQIFILKARENIARGKVFLV